MTLKTHAPQSFCKFEKGKDEGYEELKKLMDAAEDIRNKYPADQIKDFYNKQTDNFYDAIREILAIENEIILAETEDGNIMYILVYDVPKGTKISYTEDENGVPLLITEE